ncbi:hypothetical protein RCL1_007094 [Eukaryota sp. TZLM3-RCL]
MVIHYTALPTNPEQSVKTKGSYLNVSFKNTRETCAAIKGMSLEKAKAYFTDVLAHKRCIPFRRFNGHVGRTGQAKEFGAAQGRWPEKSIKFVQDLLRNAEASAARKGLSNTYISHVAVNQAPKGRRRTYRAHGRINPFMSHPCHVELHLSVRAEQVQKASEIVKA